MGRSLYQEAAQAAISIVVSAERLNGISTLGSVSSSKEPRMIKLTENIFSAYTI